MNIKVQICGIVLMLVILCIYKSQKKIQLHTERAFLRMFCVSILSVSLDILSVAAIADRDRLPALWVEAICKTYLVSLILVGLCSFLYICADIYTKGKQYTKVACWYFILIIISILCIYILPIQYFHKGTALYTYGASVLTTYITAAFLLLSNAVLMIRNRTKINPVRRGAVQLWMFLWCLAALVQFFNNHLLIVGYACAIGNMILYLKMENPETNLDKETGLFNRNAYIQYTKQLYGNGKNFSLLSMRWERSLYKSMQPETKAAVRQEIIGFISKIPDVLLFQNNESELLLLFEQQKKAEWVIRLLLQRFTAGWGEEESVSIRPDWIFIPDASKLGDAEETLYLIRYARQENKEFADNHFFCVDDKMISRMYEEKNIENLLIRAIEQEQVEVYYQPIYSTKEQKFTCAEALVRIRDEEGNLVPPAAFINIAERNGMILRLGEIIFEKVCRFLKENDLEKYGIHYMEVNLSVVQCSYEHLAEAYIGIMKKYDIKPGLINLEITESASLRGKKTLLDNMKSLMEYGIKFSLDDFGTGHSNLNYIVDMPVDIVKFDREMSNAYFENGKAKYVMDAAMHMIQGMELEIVSEGIETKEQCQVMEDLGISYIQGYYFSKPLPEEEFLAFLSGQRE